MSHCPNCEEPLATGARFCSQCGASLADGVQDTAGERRQVTVAFCDLSGYTAMTEALPAEDVRDVMAQIFTAAGDLCEEHRGHIHQLLGDGVMAFFGVDVAHEDDAERAVQFVLDLHERVTEISASVAPRIGRDLTMHSGVNTGLVITGSLTVGSAVAGPLGDTINVAARLEALSEAGEILIGNDTKALVDRSFELVDHGSHAVQGKSEELQVWKVAGRRSETAGPSRQRAAFVGRSVELGALRSGLQQLRDGEGSVVSICAEAGSGKSRLVEEFHAEAAGEVTWIEGRAFPSSQQQPYSVLIDLMRRSAGIEEGEQVEKVHRKLRDLAAGLLLDPDEVVSPLGRLFSLDDLDDERDDREAFAIRLKAALSRFVRAVADREPTVVCLQDLHWADHATASFLRDFISDLGVPVLFVCNFRPTFRLGVAGEREVRLEPLGHRHISELIGSVLDTREPPPDLVAFVLERSDGNPFYAEEIMNRLVETGTVDRDGVDWTIASPLTDADVPGTIRGLIGSRIDALDPERRRVLRQAAVVGRQFLYDLVESILESRDALQPALNDLEEGDFIRRVDQAVELEYIFKHALTQEVAYDGLLREERELLHTHVAEAIESKLSHRLGEFAETVAHHYLRSSVPRRAVPYLQTAASKAIGQYALEEADGFYRAAYELLADASHSAEDDRMLAELLFGWCQVHYYHARFTEMRAMLERHADLRNRLDDEHLAVTWDAWWGHADYQTGPTLSASIPLLEDAAARARSAGDAEALTHALAWRCWPLWQVGRAHEVPDVWDELEAHLPEITSDQVRRYPYIKGKCGVGISLALLGDIAGARQAGHDLADMARSSGNARAASMGHIVQSLVAMSRGDFLGAVAEAKLSNTAARDRLYELHADLWTTALAVFAMDLDTLEEVMERAPAEIESLGIANWQRIIDVSIGAHRLLSGRLTNGMKTIEAAHLTLVAADDRFTATVAEVVRASVLARVATGEAEREMGAIVANPGFVVRHVRGAGRRAMKQLRSISDSLPERSMEGLRFPVDYELAKLAVHRKDWGEATAAITRARAFLARIDDGVDPVPPGLALVDELAQNIPSHKWD